MIRVYVLAVAADDVEQVSITAEASYGLGWLVDRYKGVPMFHHMARSGQAPSG